MGAISNAVANVGTGVGKVGVGLGRVTEMAGAGPIAKLARDAASNLDAGSRACPIVGECRDVGAGILQGDFQKAALAGGVLALDAAAVHGAAGKVGVASASSGTILGRVAGLGTANQVLKNGSQQRYYNKVLTKDTISDSVKDCQYAVRGAIPMRGEEIVKEMAAGKKFPFTKMTPCNIGNPQAVGQGHMTFNREILSGALYPDLLKTDALSKDAQERVKLFLSQTSPMGAYTSNSKGFEFVREAVCKFIEKRDGPAVKASVDNIYLTNGASEGVRQAFSLLLRDQLDGVMVPIPQYPLYSALLTLEGGTMVKYYLDESQNWGVDPQEIQNRIKNAKDLGVRLRAITIINPGNPTGQVLQRADIENIIKIAHEHEMAILADEVYQNNTYADVPFTSFRKVLAEMGEPYSNNVELISMHSTSKGLQGECGLRGGYFETVNLDGFIEEMIYKLKSIELCSNTVGQLATYAMVSPPVAGVESDDCVKLYEKQKNDIYQGLKDRANILTKTFNQMDNVSSQTIQGAMYGFPKVEFSDKALKAAAEKGVPADSLYCMGMVNETGIMTVPGSGFGQREGTYHFRMTNLVTPTSEMVETLDLLQKFNTKFHDTYS